MSTSSDAAEQIVRIGLEGTEIALRLTGSAAKNIAAMLYAAAKNADKTKTRGHQRLSAMLKSGKELRVFTVSEKHLKQFSQEAKRYGVVYCALRGREPSEDGLVDVMVRAEDASKINRIVERFKFATVETTSIQNEVSPPTQNRDFFQNGRSTPPSEPISRTSRNVGRKEKTSVHTELTEIQQKHKVNTALQHQPPKKRNYKLKRGGNMRG